jgi:photosystem II stability/assembly factor-like uncharacterized protein
MMHPSSASMRGLFVGIIILSIFIQAGIATGSSDIPGKSQQVQTTPDAPSTPSKVFFPLVYKPLDFLPPSRVVIDNRQAFDKCALPTTGQMQTWWNYSPYAVFALYLGGISFYCSSNPLDNAWLEAVARQGWSFIPVWVGLQAPCTSYTYRMSSNTSTAYTQGRSEASSAAAAAALLGFLNEKIIYYDLESFSGADQSCRDAAKSFIRGWVKRLHELGIKAGAYGAPCTSYISDWATVNPMPDDVWIAHWKLPYAYDSLVTVWNTPCLSNSLWTNHQRLRQYSGGHSETWGGLSMTIDSDVLDGEVTTFRAALAAAAEPSIFPSETLAALTAPQLRDMDLISAEAGWALVGDRLLWTQDGGQSWQEITPPLGASAEILGVKFLDARIGWLVQRALERDQIGELSLLRTQDGGVNWEALPSPVSTGGEALSIEAAQLDFIDAATGWLAVKLQSGSSFSLGRLWATQDGGHTWEERSLPLGEAVKFLDAERGWVAGGPEGDELYRTADGGRTWQRQELAPSEANVPGSRLVGLPDFVNEQDGLLPMTLSGEAGSAFVLYATNDGGESWSLETRQDLEPGSQPGNQLPFSLAANGRWWAGAPETAQLYTASAPSERAMRLTPAGLPEGVVVLDFASDQAGWALVQQGACQGYKAPAGEQTPPGAEPFRCTLNSNLMSTMDGGQTWEGVTFP